MKNTKQIAAFCFLSDVGLSLWSYFKLTNYDEYLKAIKPMISSPDFQVQIYKILVQSIVFSLILFILFHLIIYILLWKEKKYALKYIRFYSLMAAVSALLLIITNSTWGALIPLIIYTMSFMALGKLLKECARNNLGKV